MDVTPDVVYLVLGAALLVASVLPRLLSQRAFSPAMGYLAIGLVVGASTIPFPLVDPLVRRDLTLRLTEITVIISLMGVGLALDRRVSWRGWLTTWRLLAIGMPLGIAGMALATWGLMGLAPSAALLLAAVLAPTDPVLASDVQVGAPSDNADEEDEVRFALTSEAGLNDGLAFPVVYLAIYAATRPSWSGWFTGWLAWELVGKVLIGLVVGAICGTAIGWLAFRSRALRFAAHGEAMVALAATFLVYGLTELLGGWGFIGVFVAALAVRDRERGSSYHQELHAFTEEIERILVLVLLLLFGVAMASGLLDALTWGGVAVAIVSVVVIRPVVGWLSLLGRGLGFGDTSAIAFFGVRGIGSFYYLAYATNQATFDGVPEIWSTVAFTVLLSVVLHGALATPWMTRLEHRRHARTGRAQGDLKTPGA